MRGRLVVALLVGSCALAVALALVMVASATSRAPVFHARTLTVHLQNYAAAGPIEGLALDGTEAAFVKGVPFTPACPEGHRVYRWDLATGRTSLVSGSKTCAEGRGSTGAGIFAIGLAGSHSAWLLNQGGNIFGREVLFAATAKPGTDTVLANAWRRFITGDWIGGLVSDGSRITDATWSIAKKGPTGASGPIGAVGPTGVLTASALWRISGSTATKIADGSGAVVSASADGGRVALLRSDGSAAVYGSDGRLLHTIVGAAPSCAAPIFPGLFRCWGEAIALTGKLVAVLADPKIQVYDRTSGALLHSWPNITAWLVTFDAYNGIAVYGTGSSLHALDLRTGKNTVVAKRNFTIEQARLDKAGLLYYFNGSWSAKNGQNGLLVFVPFKTIAAKLGR